MQRFGDDSGGALGPLPASARKPEHMDENKNLEDKDVAYSPASDTDTESMQGATTPPTTGPADPDVDYDAVNVLPG